MADNILKSNKSYLLNGPGGVGKSSLIKDIQRRLHEQGKKYISLAPTNLAASAAAVPLVARLER